jgi:serine/threonine-protein kinase
MEKRPADRFGSAAEFAAALVDSSTTARYTGGSRLPVRRSVRPGVLATAALGLAAVALLVGRWTAPKPEGPAPSRLAILPPEQGSVVSAGLARILDISQDGQLVAFAANGPASDYVALRRLDAPGATAMPNSSGIRNLRISPDGQHIVSPRSTSTLQRASIGVGNWSTIPSVATTGFLDWSSDGSMWWTPFLGGGTYRTRPGATAYETPFASDSGGFGPVIQQILPGDRKALVVLSARTNAGLAGVRDLETGEVTNLFDFPVVEIRYTAGVLVYARPDNTLNAVAFDPGKGVATADPIVLADDVALTGGGVAQFAVSGNGTVAYLPSFGRELVQVGRNGQARRLTDEFLNYHSPKFSPSGRLIALDITGVDGRDVWVFDREQRQLSRSTFDRDGHDAVWSRDGRMIYYLSQKSGTLGVYRVRPGGGGKADSVFAHPSNGYTGIPVGAGDTLVTVASELNGRSGIDVALIHVNSPGRIEPLFASRFDEGWAMPSPDGKWLAFSSDESGRQEVYVHPMSPDGVKVQVSIDGGGEPVWAANGRELFYRKLTGGAAHLVAAELELAGEARVVKRTVLFDASEYEPAQPHASYDVSPDGQSFVMLRRSPATHIVVIQNVQELVRRAQAARTP